jgi:hypothetical protein
VRPESSKEDRPVQVAADLPPEFFLLTRVSLADVAQPSPKIMGLIARLVRPQDRLEALDLTGCGMSQDDLRKLLEKLTRLNELSLARTAFGNDLRFLKDMKRLRRLVLDGLLLGGPELEILKGLPDLKELSLQSCLTLTDDGAEFAGALKQLEKLSLAGNGLTDKGLKALSGLKALQNLDVRDTRVTKAGADALQKDLPKCKILFGPSKR